VQGNDTDHEEESINNRITQGAKNSQNVSGAVVRLDGQNTDIRLIIHSWRNLHNGHIFPVHIRHEPVCNYLDMHKVVHVTHLKTMEKENDMLREYFNRQETTST